MLNNSRAWRRMTKKESGAGPRRAESPSGARQPLHYLAEDDEGEPTSGGLNQLVSRNAEGAQCTWKVVTVVDSGAAENAMPRSMFSHIGIRQTERSRTPEGFVRKSTWQVAGRGNREPGAGSVGSRAASWVRTRTLIGKATKTTRRSVSAGVVMRGGHCLRVWKKKQQVVSLSSTESELYAAVKAASEGLGISCGLNLHLDASATMCLVNRRGLGKAKHVDMQNLWIEQTSKSDRFITKKVGTSVNPADLMTKPLPRPKIEQLTSLMGSELIGIETGCRGVVQRGLDGTTWISSSLGREWHVRAATTRTLTAKLIAKEVVGNGVNGSDASFVTNCPTHGRALRTTHRTFFLFLLVTIVVTTCAPSILW